MQGISLSEFNCTDTVTSCVAFVRKTRKRKKRRRKRRERRRRKRKRRERRRRKRKRRRKKMMMVALVVISMMMVILMWVIWLIFPLNSMATIMMKVTKSSMLMEKIRIRIIIKRETKT